MSALQYLAPEFIKEGRLKWLKAPLYIVKNNKKEDYFYSDEEFNKSKIKGTVSRAKGLGSLSADQARASMFGKNQRLEILNYSEEGIQTLIELMGEDIEPRREFVFNKIDFSEVRE